MKKLYTIVITLLCTVSGWSQALSDYTFSAFSSSYTALTTSYISSSGGASWGTTSFDDPFYNSISIGFNFVYCGTTYTSLAASQNCWIVLGHNIPTGSGLLNTYTPDLKNTAVSANLPRPILAALWTDIITSGRCVRYETSGSAPNRVFTIEWNNVGFYSSTTARECVQIKLYETSNIIDFCYNHVSSGSYSLGLCSIGISGGDGSYAVSGTQPAWMVNNTGSSPTPSMTTSYRSLSGAPASDQVYRWSPNCLGLAPTATTPVCSGSSLSFTGTVTTGTASTYYWSGPGGYTSTDMSPTITAATTGASGTYTFTATTSGGCSDSATVDVTVDSTPTSTIYGSTNICSGSSANISFYGTAGATVHYHMAGGSEVTGTLDGSGNLTVSTGVLTASGTSRYISYILDSITNGGCTGIAIDSAVITVDPNPSVITGPRGVCLGSTASLSDSISGGIWTVASSSIATISGTGSTATVGGVSVGSTTITYSLATGCYTVLPYTVYPIPTAISGPSSVCIGSTITLSDTGTGTWSSGSTSIATVGSSTGVVTGVTSGRAVITYTSAAGCRITDTVTVNPLPAAITGPSAVCAGYSITLSSTTTGGTWSSSSATLATVTGTGGVVTGVAAGSPTISYTLGTGCYRTASVTVNPLPSAITGFFAVCASGGTTSLSSTTTGGIWSSSTTSVATVGSTSGVVTGIVAGSTMISYTLSSTGCYDTAIVTVNPLPKVINGLSAVCVGSTITLTDSVPGGNWISGNTSIATVVSTSGVVTGVSAGTVLITYNLGSGCSITKSITVNPLPASISGTLTVCETQGTTTASDATSGGVWSTADASIATIDGSSGTIGGVAAGTTSISYTLTATGCAVGATVTVNPLPAAISGPGAVCESLTITLTDGGSGSWASSNTSVATIASSGTLTGISAGTTTITYTLPTSCYITRDITVNPLPANITGTTTVCEGLTTTLSDTTTGGTWSSGSTTTATINSTGTVTGVTAGTATITYQLTTGCLKTTNVTVNPLPAAITGATDVCLGATANLSETTAGGTWSSGDITVATVSGTGRIGGASVGSTLITYTLSGTGCLITHSITVNALPGAIVGPPSFCVASTTTYTDGSGTWASSNTGVATIVSTTGAATGVASGTATLTFTDANGCIATRSVTVNPLPNAITGSATVCDAGTTNLSDASSGGSWSSADTTIASISGSGSVSGMAPGTTTITYTLSTGCFTTTSITVNPRPIPITGTMNVCAGGSSTALTDGTSGGVWSSGSPSVATVNATSGVVTSVTTSAGSVVISYTIGSCFRTATVTINPLPGAIITPLGDTSLCPGDYVTFTANTGTGYTYQWYSGASVISGETDDYYVVSTDGSYRVVVTNSYNCVSTSPAMSATYFTGSASISASSTSFCTGASTALTCGTTGAGYSYQWTNSGVGIPGATNATFNATRSGDYQVLVGNTAGCYMTSTAITLTAMPAPPASIAASGALSFCLGDSVTLMGDTSSTITSFTWMVGGSPISGAIAMNLRVGAAGTYQYTATNSYGCTSTSTTLTVSTIALPNATITSVGATTICAGSTVLLQAVRVATSHYQWYKNGIAIAGATNDIYAAGSTGYYTVKVTNVSGCSAVTTPALYIEVVDRPYITTFTGTSICWGGRASLGVNITTSSSVSYQWQSAGVNIPGATSSTYVTYIGGSYSCVISVGGGCTITTLPVTIIVYPVPNPIVVYDGRYLSTTTRFTSYQWFRNMIPVATTPRYIPTTTGDYTVRVVDSNGCQTISPIFTLRALEHNGSVLGTSNLETSIVTLYPNPTNDVIHIVSDEPVRVEIASADGRIIKTENNVSEVDLSNYASGIYLFRIYSETGVLVKTEKVVKQ